MLDNNNISFRVTRELGRSIVCGVYKPNENLPTEAELCENFGVSRTSIREAVKMLSAKGLIISKPRQGIRILPQENWNIFDPDLLGWSLEGELSLQVLLEFLEVRMALEPEAAALAARRGHSEKIANIAEALENMRRFREDQKQFMEADISFHISILYASCNRFYIRMKDFICTALKASISHTTVIKGDIDAIIDDHARVLQAIESGNADRAKSFMIVLVHEAQGLIERKLGE